jgi:hypothetical protein
MMGNMVTTFFDFVSPLNKSLKFLNLEFGFTSESAFAPIAAFYFSTSMSYLFLSI